MTKKTDFSNTQQLLAIINKAIIEKKGIDLVNLNLIKTDNSITDYFVICHGSSGVHVNTIAESIIRTVKTEIKENVWQKEGLENSQWVLLDYVDIVVHVFQKEYRDFYKLEELWADATTEIIVIEEND